MGDLRAEPSSRLDNRRRKLMVSFSAFDPSPTVLAHGHRVRGSSRRNEVVKSKLNRDQLGASADRIPEAASER